MSDDAEAGAARRRATFSRAMRLSGGAQFRAVYGAKARTASGPLLLHSLPNQLGHPRLGLAVPRRIGTAVRRNLIKRRLREAFRTMQHHELMRHAGGSYDLVASVRPHEPLPLAEYRDALLKALEELSVLWTKRRRREIAATGKPTNAKRPE